MEPGDQIVVRERSRSSAYFQTVAEQMEHRFVPEWLSVDIEKLSGRVLALPTREEIEAPVSDQLITEYYSR